MDYEQRIEALEHEVRILKNEIQQTLVEIRETLPEKPASTTRWQKQAWVLALLNLLVAVALFTNIYLYIPGSLPFDLSDTLAAWLRAFWVAIAFIWLLLQMYPLALLLEQEDRQRRRVAWRSVAAYLWARPGSVVALTLVVLIVSIINAVIPAAWLGVALILLLIAGSAVVRYGFELFRKQSRAHGGG